MIEFGKSLRLAREAKGYTVAQLAEITRMAPKTVTELESENFSHIAAPIYGRGFVKLYCEAVGLEAKPFIDEFMAIFRGERDVGIRERTVQEPPAPEPPPVQPVQEPLPVTAPEPPPAPSIADLPIFDDTPIPQKEAAPPLATASEAHSTAPLATAPEARSTTPLSRYAAPVRKEHTAPTLSPAIWRTGVLAAVVILIIWGAFLGIRALYRATSGNLAQASETPAAPVAIETPAPKPDEPAKPAETTAAAKTADPAAANAPRTPQNIPSIYID